ncbi:TolC family protein, partial [Burkholderia vietnamiensis]|uniref:TolC family protein n=1 Tax=Burkholderia vietnamiensis TaxID=60552 RepID=UPI0015942D36
DDTVASFQRSLTLTQNQYAQGVAARSDVIQAQTQLQSAQASAINNGIARATYDQNVAEYRAAVLSAFQDVEDNLASLRILEQEIVVQRQAVDSAQRALDIVTNQYKAGTVDYVSVLTAQTTAFNAEQQLVVLNGNRMVSSVNLVK